VPTIALTGYVQAQHIDTDFYDEHYEPGRTSRRTPRTWTVARSLPLGQVPGRPVGVARQRRNQHLRTRVVAFLNEVRRAENYALRASNVNEIPGELEENLRSAERRMMVAASEVARVAGRFGAVQSGDALRERPSQRPRRPTRRTASP
jgi:hypothetical protein